MDKYSAGVYLFRDFGRGADGRGSGLKLLRRILWYAFWVVISLLWLFGVALVINSWYDERQFYQDMQDLKNYE